MSIPRLPGVDYNDRYTLYLPRMKSHAAMEQRRLMPFRSSVARQVELLNRFGLYLFREQHYDFPLAWDLSDGDARAYFFLGGALTRTTVQPIGCAVFAKLPPPLSWQFAWCWLHPYERGRGHMTRAWPTFKKEFGDFALQHPISFGFKAFLAKLIRNGEPQTKAIRAALRLGEYSPEYCALAAKDSKEAVQ